MKKAIKLKITLAVLVISAPFILILSLLLILGSNDSKATLAESVGDPEINLDRPERIAELMRIKAFGVPSDIVMVVTSYVCETEEEAFKKPFIFPALEFMIMIEDVQEYMHHHFDDKDPEDEDYHVLCGYETVEINEYEYKDEIKGYIGISSEEYPSELNAGNLHQKAQEAADERSKNSDKDQIRIITFEAIPLSGYAAAIRRCGVKEKQEVEGIIDLHKARYYIEWLNQEADELGINPGESTVIGGSTHDAIRYAIQNSDFADESFFGGSAILPISAGSFTLTSEYGPRDFALDPFHTGLDFATALGTPIYSVMDGIVLMRATNMNSFGHHIVIYHGGRVTTMYAHMNAFGSFKVGDRVSRGDIIGYAGDTGLSTGPHLHLEYQINGSPLNPREILPL